MQIGEVEMTVQATNPIQYFEIERRAGERAISVISPGPPKIKVDEFIPSEPSKHDTPITGDIPASLIEKLELISPKTNQGFIVSWRGELQIVMAKTGDYVRESKTKGRVEELCGFSPDGERIW